MDMTDARLDSAQVINLSIRFETLPVETDSGPVLWADIAINYVLTSLNPTIAVRVPVPFASGDTDAYRRAKALRNARVLIETACRSAGAQDEDPNITPAPESPFAISLEGIAQELGLIQPSTKPKSIQNGE